MNDYYVYEHIRKDNNTVFYVGKGHGKRVYKKVRNSHHDRIVEKYGMDVRIIKDNLSEEEAYNLEREIICHYIFDLGYGIDIDGLRNNSLYQLTNHSLGGDGSFGMVHSEEWCKQHSLDMIGEKNPMYGVNVWDTYSEEKAEKIKQKLSKSSSGEKNPMYGVSPKERMDKETFKKWHKKVSERTKNQIGEKNPNFGNKTLHNKLEANPELRLLYYSRKGAQNGRARSVDLYTIDDKFIKHFDYIGKCAEYIKKVTNARGSIDSIRSNITVFAKKDKPFHGFKYIIH